METNPPEFKYLAYDKASLLQSLTRFDGDIKEEDVVGQDDGSCQVNSVLLQVLLEIVINEFVKNEEERDILMTEVWNQLSQIELANKSLSMDKNNPLRLEMKRLFLTFLNKTVEEVIPQAEIDRSILSFLENNNLKADPDQCYYKCFKELHQIGQGGFGNVFKAKHIVTGHDYAVKKIKFNYKVDSHYLQVIREAKNIATLDHPNVVRYNNAWIEISPKSNDSKSSSTCTSESSNDFTDHESEAVSFCNDVSAIIVQEQDSTWLKSSGSSTVESCVGGYSSVSNGSSDSIIFSNTAMLSEKVNFTLGDSESYEEENNSSVTFDSVSSSKVSSSKVTSNKRWIPNLNVKGLLYIQMEYCDCDLHFWLEERSKGNSLPFDMDVTAIFTNILCGLIHIHSKGIIHRDLKPHNIFYSKASNVLKIGDFGLATLPRSSFNISDEDCVSNTYSSNIGTKPYAAPEQISSKSYDSKVDIYSLGIILIELMNNCSTSMELCRVIDLVKDGKMTEEMLKLPHLVDIVSNLVSTNPKQRRSAIEVLSYFEEDTKVELQKIKKSLHEKDLELRNMHQLLEENEKLLEEKEKLLERKEIEVVTMKQLLADKFKEVETLRNFISNMEVADVQKNVTK